MNSGKNIYKSYAYAAFYHALEQQVLLQWQEMFVLVQDFMSQEEILCFQKNYKQIKLALLVCDIFKDKLDHSFCIFIKILADNRMLFHLKDIYLLFLDKIREYKGIKHIKITTARPLAMYLLEALQEKLQYIYNLSQVEFTQNIEENIIGGIIIRIGDRVIDASVKRLLDTNTSQFSS